MARARNIKPGIFKNEVLGVADPLLTLLFEGLWLLADREGRLEDRPIRIKGEIFPYRDGLDINALLNWLQANGFIRRYEVGGKRCIVVLEFVKHQNPHKNEPESSLPPPDEIASTPEKIGSTRADSLIPDSLIPDSGCADNAPAGAAPADQAGPTIPTMAGAVCITLRAKGIPAVNPSHPDLLALLQAGVDIGSFAAAAETARERGKPSFAYVLGVVKGQAADAQRMAANARASPMPSRQPSAAELRVMQAVPSLAAPHLRPARPVEYVEEVGHEPPLELG